MKLYDVYLSGNCYKVRLFAALANIELETVPVDLANGEHQKPPLSDLNPFCQLPILQDGPHVFRDAQAILVYLAGQHGGLMWWPDNAYGQADIVQWLSFAANEVQHSLNEARLVMKFGYALDHSAVLARSEGVLRVLEKHLDRNDWLAIGRPSIADCAVYPYVAMASEGGINLSVYPHILRWIERVRKLPGYLPTP